jgi:hypothetical protein
MNLSDTEHLIRYQTYQILNSFDTELISYKNLFRYWPYWGSSWARGGREDWGWHVWSNFTTGRAGRNWWSLWTGGTWLVPNFATGHTRRGWRSLWAGERGEGDKGWPLSFSLLISPQGMLGGVGGHCEQGRGGKGTRADLFRLRC